MEWHSAELYYDSLLVLDDGQDESLQQQSCYFYWMHTVMLSSTSMN